MAIRREAFFGWHSTTSRARKLRPGTVKPWSSLIARTTKSEVDSPGAVTATFGIKLSSGPSTWVETVKYASRAQQDLQIIWDDASTTTYHSPAFAGLPPFVLNKL